MTNYIYVLDCSDFYNDSNHKIIGYFEMKPGDDSD